MLGTNMTGCRDALGSGSYPLIPPPHSPKLVWSCPPCFPGHHCPLDADQLAAQHSRSSCSARSANIRQGQQLSTQYVSSPGVRICQLCYCQASYRRADANEAVYRSRHTARARVRMTHALALTAYVLRLLLIVMLLIVTCRLWRTHRRDTNCSKSPISDQVPGTSRYQPGYRTGIPYRYGDYRNIL